MYQRQLELAVDLVVKMYDKSRGNLLYYFELNLNSTECGIPHSENLFRLYALDQAVSNTDNLTGFIFPASIITAWSAPSDCLDKVVSDYVATKGITSSIIQGWINYLMTKWKSCLPNKSILR